MNKYHVVVVINSTAHRHYASSSVVITTYHEAEKMDVDEIATLEEALNKKCKKGISAQVMSWQKYDD